MCMCELCNPHIQGQRVGWCDRSQCVPWQWAWLDEPGCVSHVGSPAPWAESRSPLMWTPTFPGLLPGKNRVVCLGFGGKSVPRNVTLWGAWGGLARRPCISQLLRLRDNLGGSGVRPHSLQCIPTLSNIQNPLLTQHILYLQDWALGTSVYTERHSALPSVPPHMPHTRHFTVWTTRSFLASISHL